MNARFRAMKQAFLLSFFIYLIGSVWGKFGLMDILFIGLEISLVCSLLIFRLKAERTEDYFPDIDGNEEDKNPPKMLVLGKEVEPQALENEKDDRYFRLLEGKRKVRYWFSLCLYLILSVLLVTFLKDVIKNFDLSELSPLSYVLIPFFGGCLVTRSHGQLLVLPAFSMVMVFFQIPWEKIELIAKGLSVFGLLVCGFSAKKILYSLKNKTPETIEVILLNAAPFAFLASIIFLLFSPMFVVEKAPQDAELGKDIKKINKTLGRLKPNATNERYLRQLENFKKNVENTTNNPEKVKDLFSQAEKQLDQIGALTEMLSQIAPQIPEADLNILKNQQSVLKRDLNNVQIEFGKNQNVDEKSFEQMESLFKKIDDLSQKIKTAGNGMNSTKLERELGQESLEQKLKELGGNNFNDAIAEQASYSGDKAFQKKMENLLTTKEVGNAQEVFEEEKKQALSKIETEIKREKERQNLFKLETLELIFDVLKKIFAVIFVGFVLVALKKFFSEDQDLSDGQGLTKEEKKELLLRKRYASYDEEIRTLFIQYMVAIKKIYFGEYEPPPPKVLLPSLFSWYPKKKKAISFFLEVFSLAEYGAHEIKSSTMRKYRRAYRQLIKNL